MASIMFHVPTMEKSFRRPDGIVKSKSKNIQQGGTELSMCHITTTPMPTSTIHYENVLTKRRAVIIGSIQLVAAVFVITMSFIKINNQKENSSCNESSSYVHEYCTRWSVKNILSSEIWFGIIFGLSGLFTILAGCRPSRCNSLYCLIFAIISVLTSLFLLFYSVIWHSISLVISIVHGLVSFVCLVMTSRDTCHKPHGRNVV